MAMFLANEIDATDRDVTGPTEQVQIMFPLTHSCHTSRSREKS